MPSTALHSLWQAVRRDFDRARSLLPLPPVETSGSVARLDEWLDHNELELALDELECLGVDNSVPPDFWLALAAAAERMGLENHRVRLAARAP